MDNVILVKQRVRMEEWAQQMRTCRESGSSVAGWCRENGSNPKTYWLSSLFRTKRTHTLIVYATKYVCTENCAQMLRKKLNGNVDLYNIADLVLMPEH